MKKEIIHIAFALYDKNGNYSKNTGATIISIFSNTKSNIVVHILHDKTLSEKNKKMFLILAQTYNHIINFYKMELPSYIYNYRYTNKLSPGTLFRILIPNMLKNVSKVIYLDSDVVVCLDILELWNIDIKKKAIAAVLECDCSGKYVCEIDEENKKLPLNFDLYFNAGVIVFNLDKVRLNYDTWNECVSFLNEYPKAPWLDQPALNYVFQNDCEFISNKFNYWPGKEKKENKNCIYHFAEPTKPYMARVYKEDYLYWKYLKLTPWGENEEEFLSFYGSVYPFLEEGMLNQHIRSKKKFVKNFFKRLFKELIRSKFRSIKFQVQKNRDKNSNL